MIFRRLFLKWKRRLLLLTAFVFVSICFDCSPVCEFHRYRHSRLLSLLHKIFTNFPQIIEDKILEKRVQESEIKLVLDWTKYFGTNLSDLWNWGNLPCTENRCYFTSDRTQILNASALLFFNQDFTRFRGLAKDIPPIRYSWQSYIFFDREPSWMAGDLSWIRPNFFNFTLTHLQRSTSRLPYAMLTSSALNGSYSKLAFGPLSKVQLLNITRKKTKMVAMFASRCETSGKRELFVKELRKVSITLFSTVIKCLSC